MGYGWGYWGALGFEQKDLFLSSVQNWVSRYNDPIVRMGSNTTYNKSTKGLRKNGGY